jgi:hypothetical protein
MLYAHGDEIVGSRLGSRLRTAVGNPLGEFVKVLTGDKVGSGVESSVGSVIGCGEGWGDFGCIVGGVVVPNVGCRDGPGVG